MPIYHSIEHDDSVVTLSTQDKAKLLKKIEIRIWGHAYLE